MNKKLLGFLLSSIILPSSIFAQENDEYYDDSDEDVIIVTQDKYSNWTTITPDTEALLNIAGDLGDPLRNVLSLPGIIEVGGTFTLPSVRGFGPGHNRYFIDGVPTPYMYNPLGFSMLNDNIIHQFDLVSSGYQSNYDAGIGGVFDFTLRRAKKTDKPTGIIDLGMLHSGFLLETSLSEDASFYIAGRTTLIDKFLDDGDDDDLDIYPRSVDFQSRFSYDISDRSKFDLTLLYNKDEAQVVNTPSSFDNLYDSEYVGFNKDVHNFSGQIATWNYALDNESSFKLSLSNMNYDYNFAKGASNNGEILPGLEEFGLIQNGARSIQTLNLDYVRQLSEKHKFSTGLSIRADEYELEAKGIFSVCTLDLPSCLYSPFVAVDDKKTASSTRLYFYAMDNFQVSDKFSLNAGLSYSSDDLLDYSLVEPRVTGRYEIDDNSAIKFLAGMYHSHPGDGVSTGSNPAAVFTVPRNTPREYIILPHTGNPNLEPVKSTSFSIGYERYFSDSWKFKADYYYVDITDELKTQLDKPIKVINGYDGNNSGIELYLQKTPQNDSKYDGWVALTMADAQRTDKETNVTSNYRGSLKFAANIVLNYKITDTFYTGLKYTYNSGLYSSKISGIQFDNNGVPSLLYSSINTEQLPSYNRVDLRFGKFFNEGVLDGFELYVDFLNVFGTDNTLLYAISDQIRAEDVLGNNDINIGANDLQAETGLPFFAAFGLKYKF